MTKVMKVGQVPFSCVKLAEANFNDRAAVYAVLSVHKDEWKVLDVGQSAEVGISVNEHPRNAGWKAHAPAADIWIGVYSMPTDAYKKEDRFAIERKLRRQYNPPCGKR